MRSLHRSSKSILPAEIVVLFVTAILVGAYTYQQNDDDWNTLPKSQYHLTLNTSYMDQFDEVLVIGDVHGCYDELRLLLQLTNTSGNNALKILLGDMMTRGPKSIEVLNYVRHTPSILAVRGNHGDDVLRTYFRVDLNAYFGGHNRFVKNLLSDHVRFLTNIPYTISIPSLNAVMVHAGLMPGLPLEQNTPRVMTHMRNIKVDNVTGKMCPLATSVEGVAWASLWRGPQHVYFGHDHPRNLQLYPLATGTDTSAVYGEYLTAVFIKGPRKGQIKQLKALRAYYVAPTEDPLKAADVSCLQQV